MNYAKIIKQLKAQKNPGNIAGMARFGITAKGTLGVPVPVLRAMAKKIGPDHALALKLWTSGIHEARLLATMTAEPARMFGAHAERWVRDFDSWDICDQACMNLLRWRPSAFRHALAWSRRKEEFVKRAGFALMAALASGDKKAGDEQFGPFLTRIKAESDDERNFVKKAVNWALRGIGKRNRALNRAAVRTAEEILKMGTPAGRWIALDALRELKSSAVQKRISDAETR